MKNYKMTISYDGRKYNGYKKTVKSPEKTIQFKLESILEKQYDAPVVVTNAVNTAPGVHALGQVIDFTTPNDNFDADEIKAFFNEFLPSDIIILSLEEADDRFHSRYQIKTITYEYRLWKSNAHVRPLFERQRVNLMNGPLNIDLMIQASEKIVGRHDFSAYTNNKKLKNPVKEVKSIQINETDNEIIITIEAVGFHLNMERYIVGTLIQIGLGQRALITLDYAFESGDNTDVGHKAMAPALYLKSIQY